MADVEALDPQEAKARLGKLLKEGLRARQLTHRDLAGRARLSPGAVYNAVTGKAVPNYLTLQQLLDAMGIHGEERKVLEALRDQAEPRTRRARAREELDRRRLDDYVAAAREAARGHPYPGFLPDVAPPLADVYLRQRAALQDGGRSDDRGPAGPLGDGARPLPAEEAMAGKQTCVVLAGPGGGKSSLLRIRLAEGLDRWAADPDESEVPVLVQAAPLAERTFSEALAAAVSENLKPYGLLSSLSAEFFATPPQPGARWLVLVDGLDEVTEPVARYGVLQTLASLARGRHAHLYRFVVATRPLATGELRALGPDVPQYELLRFSVDDVERVACGWFGALGQSEPEQAAKRFTQELALTRVADLARIPLMTAMLCQLHAVEPDGTWPGSRGEIYHRFTELLHKRQYAVVSPGTRPEHHAGLERYGPSVLAQAERTLASLFELIALLAAERRRDETLSAIDLLESQPDAQRPIRVPQDEWRAFLEVSLLRSGLLTVRAGEFVFLHQTLLEYCAARHASLHARAQELDRLLVKRWYGRWPWRPVPLVGARGWGRRFWDPPGEEEASYYSFLLDDGEQDATVVGTELEVLATRGGLDGCRFLVVQHHLGTALPPSVTRAAADTLARLCRVSHTERWLAKVAQTLGTRDDPATDIDRVMWRAASAIAVDDRVRAAETLLLLGDSRGSDALAELARAPYLTSACGAPAAVRLAMLGDGRGADLLAALARDTDLTEKQRLRAAGFLAELGDERGAELLMRLARNAAVGYRQRAEAAAWLADIDRHATDTAARTNATRMLTAFGNESGADMLVAFAHDSTWSSSCRLLAADLLAQLPDGRAGETYAALASDATMKWWHRRRARRTADATG